MSLLTGFGLDPEDVNFARFTVSIQGREDVYPDWESPTLVRNRQFAGSSSFMTQVSGFAPNTLMLQVDFDDSRQLDLLMAKQLTESTLVLLAGFTSHDGEIRTLVGRDYIFYPNTLLLNLGNVNREIGGGGSCTATFQRAWDPRLKVVPS